MLTLLILVASQLVPAIAFTRSVVWPWMPGTAAVVFATAAAAAWRHLLVRRELVRAENEKIRYQQTMQFVTHEMRTPLTAIQGSSELIGRYGSMPEAKRKQMADLINAESKRLARMISTFLSLERLSENGSEIKQERFRLQDWSNAAPTRARPLAENKQIEIAVLNLPRGRSRRRPRIDGVCGLQSADERRQIFAARGRASRFMEKMIREIACAFRSRIRESAWIKRKSGGFSKNSTGPKKPSNRAKWAPASGSRS